MKFSRMGRVMHATCPTDESPRLLRRNFDASVFETTIRVVGGLLSAHDLTGEAIFLQKCPPPPPSPYLPSHPLTTYLASRACWCVSALY